MLVDKLSSYKGKKVLVTGHTGFKGSWLALWLNSLGADVVGYSLDPKEEKSLYSMSNLSSDIVDCRGDIRDTKKLNELIAKEKPEIIFHLAAQALVIDGYEDPLATYEINTLGTAYVLDAVRKHDCVKCCICITTDKVYHNNEWLWPYRENDRLGGYDPYSASKAAAEIVIDSYRNSFFNINKFEDHKKSVASVRAGNVIGGGDWSKNRLVPDCIHSIFNNVPIEVRNPQAVRPWQHVIEPLGGYLLLGANMLKDPIKYNESWNFGPESSGIVNVKDLVEKLIEKGKMGSWVDKSNPDSVHEATLLALDINKAKSRLNWAPVLSFDETIEFTVDWYQSYQNTKVDQLCISQINKYMELWKSRNEN